MTLRLVWFDNCVGVSVNSRPKKDSHYPFELAVNQNTCGMTLETARLLQANLSKFIEYREELERPKPEQSGELTVVDATGGELSVPEPRGLLSIFKRRANEN